jgi:hypothetical protein
MPCARGRRGRIVASRGRPASKAAVCRKRGGFGRHLPVLEGGRKGSRVAGADPPAMAMLMFMSNVLFHVVPLEGVNSGCISPMILFMQPVPRGTKRSKDWKEQHANDQADRNGIHITGSMQVLSTIY